VRKDNMMNVRALSVSFAKVGELSTFGNKVERKNRKKEGKEEEEGMTRMKKKGNKQIKERVVNGSGLAVERGGGQCVAEEGTLNRGMAGVVGASADRKEVASTL
jgi:hypothetical protein